MRLFLSRILAYLQQFVHGGVFGLSEDVSQLRRVAQSHGDAYKVFQRDESLLLKPYYIAHSHTRFLRHLLASDVFLFSINVFLIILIL